MARWSGLLAILALVVGCGVIPGTGSAPQPTSAPTSTPGVQQPTATTTSATPTATAAARPTSAPAATSASASANTVYVGNTDGEGVYLRNTPAMADRNKAYADGTALTVIGDDVDGDGQHWKHVRTPDGLEGYVPAMYTTDAPP